MLTHGVADEADSGRPLYLRYLRRAWLKLAYGYAWVALGDYEIRIPMGVLAAAALLLLTLAIVSRLAPK